MVKTKRSVSFKQATVRLSREQSDEIDKASSQLGISTAEVIRLALDELNLKVQSQLKKGIEPQNKKTPSPGGRKSKVLLFSPFRVFVLVRVSTLILELSEALRAFQYVR